MYLLSAGLITINNKIMIKNQLCFSVSFIRSMAQGDANVTLKVLISIGDNLTSNLGATTGWWSLKAALATCLKKHVMKIPTNYQYNNITDPVN